MAHDTSLDKLRFVKDLQKIERERIHADLKQWNISGYMSDCLGVHWNDLLKIIDGTWVDDYNPED